SGQLGPHDQRHDAADQEEHERGDQVEVADHLVVGRGQPLGEDAALGGGPLNRRSRCGEGILDGGHWALPAWLDATYWLNSSFSTSLTEKSMRLWSTPHSSAQRPA